MTIKAKFAGNCKSCSNDWGVGDEIHYSKDPRAICTDEQCFNKQKANGSGAVASRYSAPTFEIVNPNVDVSPEVKASGELVLQAITVAHAMAQTLNDGIEINSHTFGQIRSKLTDQILFAHKVGSCKSSKK